MRFTPGAVVRVVAREHEGHHRTPTYVQGKTGRVERAQGEFTNPETRAYGGDGLPQEPVYLVRFAQHDVWPGYRGDPSDRIYLDVYEHWLEEAE